MEAARRADPQWRWDPELGSEIRIVDRTDASESPNRAPLPPDRSSMSVPDLHSGPRPASAGEEECDSGDQYWLWQTPLAPGERFALCTYVGDGKLWLRVFDVQDPIVLAYVEEDSSRVTTGWRARLDTAVTFITQSELPHLNAAYQAGPAVTFPATEQLLIQLGEGGPMGAAAKGGFGYSRQELDPRQAVGYVRLNLLKGPSYATGTIWLLVHELAHLWQDAYHAKHWDGDRVGTGWTRWASEGAADFLGFEAVRRFLGIGLEDNIRWKTYGPEKWYTEMVFGASGILGAGYQRTAGFFQDLVIRSMEASGRSYDEVIGDVLIGAWEGWHGNVPNGTAEPGLTERMQRYIPGWEPLDGVLTWTLSQAMDDRTESRIHQNPAFYRAWQDPIVRFGGNPRGAFRPYATFGAPDSPSRAEFNVSPGTAGYVLVEAPAGASLLLEGDSLAWSVGRYR